MVLWIILICRMVLGNFILDEPIGVDSLGKTPLKIPTDQKCSNQLIQPYKRIQERERE